MNIFIGHNVIGSDVVALDKSLRDPGSRFHEVPERFGLFFIHVLYVYVYVSVFNLNLISVDSEGLKCLR